MKFKIPIIVLSLLISINNLSAQGKFQVEVKETNTWKSLYLLKDEAGNLIKELDSSIYLTLMSDGKLGNFALFAIKDKMGWLAIDRNEKVLFEVLNASFGEPNPDQLVEDKIRIVDKNNKIGFANSEGKIIIKPKFEFVTSFHNGKAIIGENCKKVPWGDHSDDGGCHHYTLVCKRYGYINEKGKIIKIGDFTFEEIMKEIDWKYSEE